MSNQSRTLARNVSLMTNRELTGLASNMFCPDDVQLAIYKLNYRLANQYLSLNTGLSREVRDELWSRRGYIFKCNLIEMGHYSDDVEKYYDLYEQTPWLRSPWRMVSTFFTGWRTTATDPYSSYEPGYLATPTDLIDRIHSDWCIKGGKYYDVMDNWKVRSWQGYISRHPSTSKQTLLLIAAKSEGKLRQDVVQAIQRLEQSA